MNLAGKFQFAKAGIVRYSLVALVTIYTLYLMNRLAGFNALTSVADDSVNYLAMARYYSPWKQATEAIISVWPLQDFPPFFPMVLAITGAAHSLPAAHLLVVLFGIAALMPLYLLGIRIVGDRNTALAIAVLFLLLPGTVLGLQGILSESLYLLLSLICLATLLDANQCDRKKQLVLALVLAFIMLTRSVGMVLWIAISVHILVGVLGGRGLNRYLLQIVVFAAAVYLLVDMILGPHRDSHYFQVLADFLLGRDTADIAGGTNILIVQLMSLVDAWRSYLILYWLDEITAGLVLSLLLLVMAIAVLAVRIRHNHIDAWYASGVLLLLFIWPHPGQMVRLIFPLVPLLLVYAAVAVLWMAKPARHYRHHVTTVAFLLVLAVIVPSHFFIHGRLDIAREHQMVPVYELIRKLDPEAARRDMLVQNGMFRDLQQLASTTGAQDRIMYFEPALVAVMSDRQSTVLGYPARADTIAAQLALHDATHIWLTEIHPRKSRAGVSGLDYSNTVAGFGRLVWESYTDTTPVSRLFMINQ